MDNVMYASPATLAGVMLLLLVTTTAQAQTCVKRPSVPGIDPNDVIATLQARIVTSSSILSGSENNDVWLDIGPKAWKLEGDFPRGSTRLVSPDVPVSTIQENSGLTPSEVALFVRDIRFIRLEKKGIGIDDLPTIDPVITPAVVEEGKKIGGITNAPDHVLDFVLPGGASPQNVLSHMKDAVAVGTQALQSEQAILSKLQAELEKHKQTVLNAVSEVNKAANIVIDLQAQMAKAAVVARLVWKSEMAHSSGELFNHEPATRQGGHRRNAPWASIPGLEEGRLTGERARWAS